MGKPVQIRKYSGDTVEFDRNKLISSLTNAGSGIELANAITEEVEKRLFDGISTKTIYQMAFKRLKKSRRTSASKYKIKKAIMELGPFRVSRLSSLSAIFSITTVTAPRSGSHHGRELRLSRGGRRGKKRTTFVTSANANTTTVKRR